MYAIVELFGSQLVQIKRNSTTRPRTSTIVKLLSRQFSRTVFKCCPWVFTNAVVEFFQALIYLRRIEEHPMDFTPFILQQSFLSSLLCLILITSQRGVSRFNSLLFDSWLIWFKIVQHHVLQSAIVVSVKFHPVRSKPGIGSDHERLLGVLDCRLETASALLSKELVFSGVTLLSLFIIPEHTHSSIIQIRYLYQKQSTPINQP